MEIIERAGIEGADLIKQNDGKCIYEEPWVGKCKCSTVNNGEFCEKHYQEKCIVCGEQAVRGCTKTYQFVCGNPLCNTCECGCTKT